MGHISLQRREKFQTDNKKHLIYQLRYCIIKYISGRASQGLNCYYADIVHR